VTFSLCYLHYNRQPFSTDVSAAIRRFLR